MTPAGRVVVVGDVMVDVSATASVPLVRGSDAPADVRFRGGGSGANVAAWLAASGVPTTLIGRVGDDPAGRADTAALRSAGVDVRLAVDPRLPTGTCVTIVEPDGERTFLPDRGANRALTLEDLAADLFVDQGGHLHLSGYVLLDDGPGRAAGLAALRLATSAGMTISVDPSSSGPLRSVGRQAFLEWTAGTHVLLPNADELLALTGEADPAEGARRLVAAAGCREVVVTLGAHGALWTDGLRTL
ncbi:MAG: hypothetical protein JWM31_1129, partial [Solirubrobacterales bacterium]|nr:hypothetical protein [Solirubrobacterales bacterium]